MWRVSSAVVILALGCVASAAREGVPGGQVEGRESAAGVAGGPSSAAGESARAAGDGAAEDDDADADADPAGSTAGAEASGDAGAKAGRKRDSKMPRKRFVIKKDLGHEMAAFVAEMPREGLLWAGRLEGNGGRDVLIFVPPGADNSRDFRLVFHFHGTYSEKIQKQTDGMPKKDWVGWDRLGQAIEGAKLLQEEQPYNVALIYPLSAGRRIEPFVEGWVNKWYDRSWMDPVKPPKYRDSFDKLYDETLAILHDDFKIHPSRTRGRVIAEGHSAGGIALLHIARNGSKHVGDYLYLDASFMGWADGAYRALKKHKSNARITIVVRTGGMADPFGKSKGWCDTLDEADFVPDELHKYEDWCEKMRDDMAAVDQVYVHQTKVKHGNQPLHFFGGRNLPKEWHDAFK